MKPPATILLVVIAALLAANLFVNLSPQVGASPPRTALSGDDDEAVLVGISVIDAGANFRHVLRLWSDGVVEWRTLNVRGGSVAWPPSTDWAEVEVP